MWDPFLKIEPHSSLIEGGILLILMVYVVELIHVTRISYVLLLMAEQNH